MRRSEFRRVRSFFNNKGFYMWAPRETFDNYNLVFECGGSDSKNIAAAVHFAAGLRGLHMRYSDERVKGRTTRRVFVAAGAHAALPDLEIISGANTKIVSATTAAAMAQQEEPEKAYFFTPCHSMSG